METSMLPAAPLTENNPRTVECIVDAIVPSKAFVGESCLLPCTTAGENHLLAAGQDSLVRVAKRKRKICQPFGREGRSTLMVDSPSPGNGYSCATCQFSAGSRAQLRAHKRISHNHKTTKCPLRNAEILTANRAIQFLFLSKFDFFSYRQLMCLLFSIAVW
jgi:hypothetical protein